MPPDGYRREGGYERTDPMDRLLRLDLARLNKGLAERRVPLASLLEMDEPTVPTREEPHRFERGVLERLAGRIIACEELREERDELGLEVDHLQALKLPVRITMPASSSGSCYLDDPVAIRVLQVLGEVNPQLERREGRLWLSEPLGHDLGQRWPTLFEFAFL